jgi:hypothetical protein
MSEEIKYFMGIDSGGYDGSTFCACVVGSDKSIAYLFQTRHEEDFNREVERVSAYYDIPENKIFKEINK